MESAVSAVENLGNTKPDSREVKQYCFTLNNYTEEELNELVKTAESAGCLYIIGREIGEQGTPHLQGYLKLPIKKSWSAMMKLLNNKRIHLSACKGSQKQNAIYCSKDKRYVTNFYEEAEPLRILDELQDWMNELKVILEIQAHPRHVYWIWEPIGGTGKSSFCKFLCHKYKAIYIDEGKKSDLINIIYNIEIVNSKSIICIDVPRDNGNTVSYKAIEQIKNGMICNTKYETGMKLFNSPHLIIFCNHPPEREKLSYDRWKIAEIVEKRLVWS
jgi:hypothetical protein